MTSEIAAYQTFFRQLRSQIHGSAGAREGWIGYLYHITDIRNAVSILSSGLLYSRREAERLQCMNNDNAAAEIISSTPEEVKSYVRLFFRPRTPTFYHNEGFRSRANLETQGLNAHCPVPVALIFDAATVLSLPGVRFSEGSLATHSDLPLIKRTSAGLEQFRALPFDKIYHSEAIPADSGKRKIIYHRHAEVIVPERLVLSQVLRSVRCRSDAELRTLRYMLGFSTWLNYRSRIRTNSDASIFHAHRLFVERVDVHEGRIVIELHLPYNRSDAFDALLTVDFDVDGLESIERPFRLRASMGQKLSTQPGFLPTGDFLATIQLFLDDQLAYAGIHWLGDDPLIS